ncbi:ATP-grasp domain-containing protein [Mycoplasma amphoriforme]|uniref:ATP-grasp domain-containing protein n=1 Tax=Mycoplasma amphoriforme A39 TaxID=572419 RepID=A0A292IJ23_9MOLU|nr:unnamed protein product [Mycoplasma amphoriforme A39]
MKKTTNQSGIALIYSENDFLINKEFAQAIIHEIEKAGYRGKLFLVNHDHCDQIDLTNFDVVINRSRKGSFLKNFKNQKFIFNRVDFSEMANDKYLTFEWCKHHKIVCNEIKILDMAKAKDYRYPLLIKNRYGHHAKEINKINEFKDLLSYENNASDYIVEDFCENAKRDVRIYVMFGKIIKIIQRTVEGNEFRSNFNLNGVVKEIKLSFLKKRYVKKIIKKLPDGYYGIDFFINKNKLILNEIEDVVDSKALSKANIDFNISGLIIKNIVKKLKNAQQFRNQALSKLEY